jgi:aspartate aminotransferase
MDRSLLTRPGIRLSRRVTELRISPTLAVMIRAQDLMARGVDVIDLGPGEPDFPTPPAVAEAGKRAIDRGLTKYTANSGTKALRDAIAARYNRRWGTEVTADNVITGTGGKQELFNVILAMVEEGDEVIIPAPYWVSFPDQVQFAGGRPVFARVSGERLRPMFRDIESVATERTRGVIVNSPCNPSGAVIAEAELRKTIEWCAARDCFLIFDETYEFFVYDGAEHVSAARWMNEYPETVVVVNSMSKTFAMTGWRLGYAVAHRDIVAAANKIQSHSTSNPSSISQAAALEALTGDNDAAVRRMWEAYAERREWLIPAINSIDGFCCSHPDGAFYIFPEVKAFYGKNGIHDSQSFANYLLDEASVAVVPGGAFGSDDHVRISYATSMERLQEGVRRMEAALRKL